MSPVFPRAIAPALCTPPAFPDGLEQWGMSGKGQFRSHQNVGRMWQEIYRGIDTKTARARGLLAAINQGRREKTLWWIQHPHMRENYGGAGATRLRYVGGLSATGNSNPITLQLEDLTGGCSPAVQAGDLVIVVIGVVGTADLNLAVQTAGYTEVADLYSNDDRDANLSVSYKLMGTIPDTEVQVTGSAGATEGAVVAVHVWRGVHQSSPLDVGAQSATGTNGGAPDAPSITPVTTYAQVIACGVGTSTGTQALTAPSGYTNLVTTTVDPGTGVAVAIASKVWGGGAENPAAFGGGSADVGDSWAAVTLALRPADNVAPNAVVISGGSQTGSNILISGAVASQAGYWRKGDLVKLGSLDLLYDVSRDVNTVATGNDTLPIHPPIFAGGSPANLAAVHSIAQDLYFKAVLAAVEAPDVESDGVMPAGLTLTWREQGA